MKRFLAMVLCAALSSMLAFGSEPGFAVKYDGGTLPNLKVGTGLRLQVDQDSIKIFAGKTLVQTIAPASITEISYGQDVHRRVGAAVGLAIVSFGLGALMVLAKSKKHYVGLTWATADVRGGIAIQCDKNDYRGLLAALEGVTGKKAVNSETTTVKN